MNEQDLFYTLDTTYVTEKEAAKLWGTSLAYFNRLVRQNRVDLQSALAPTSRLVPHRLYNKMALVDKKAQYSVEQMAKGK